MKKFLLPLFATAVIFSTAKAQTNYSFESSEGFTVGELKGQNANIGTFHDTMANTTGNAAVSTAQALTGTNSVKLINSNDTLDAGFFIVNIPAYSSTTITYNIFVPELDGSDSFAVFYDDAGALAGAIDFDYNGNLRYFDSSGAGSTIGTYTEAQWNKLDFKIDFTAKTVNVLLNGTSVFTGAYGGTGTAVSETDFYIDNYGSDAYVDDISIKDGSLATSEVSRKNSLNVFPNPAVDYVRVNADGKAQGAQLFDASGRLVKTFNDASGAMNVSDLKKGIYIMKVKTDKGTSSAKVIKK